MVWSVKECGLRFVPAPNSYVPLPPAALSAAGFALWLEHGKFGAAAERQTRHPSRSDGLAQRAVCYAAGSAAAAGVDHARIRMNLDSIRRLELEIPLVPVHNLRLYWASSCRLAPSWTAVMENGR